MRFIRWALFLGLLIIVLTGSLFADVTISGMKVTNLRSTSATFTWFTSEPTETNMVYYRALGDVDWTTLNEISNEGNAVNVHYIKMDYDLIVNTTYEYKMESNGIESSVGVFTTIPAANPTEFPKILSAKAQNEDASGAIYAIVFAKLKKQGHEDFEEYELSARVASTISGGSPNTEGVYSLDISHFVNYPGYALSVGDEIHLFGYLSESTSAFDMVINDGNNVIVDNTPMIFNGLPEVNNYNSFDENSDGMLDKIEITFDKTLNATILPDVAAFTVTAVESKTILAIDQVNIVDQKLILTVTPDGYYTGQVKFSYDSALTENKLQDTEGVLVDNITDLMVEDNAAPAIVSFDIMDLYDNSVNADYALVEYSEKITGLSVTNPTNYIFSASGISQAITNVVIENNVFARVKFSQLHYGDELNVTISNIKDDSDNTIAQYTNTVIVPSNDNIIPTMTFVSSAPAVITDGNTLHVDGNFVEQTEVIRMEYRLVESAKRTGWIEFDTYNNDTKTWTLDLSDLIEGNTTLYIKATDYNENVSANLTANFRVNYVVPVIENANFVATETELQFSFDITDIGGTINYEAAPVVIVTNGVDEYPIVAEAYVDNSWSGVLSIEGLNDGAYDLSLSGIIDTDGLTAAEYGMEDVYTKDTTAPVIEFDVENDNVFNTTDITIAGTIADAVSDITLAEYKLNDGDWQAIVDFANFSIELSDLEAGNYILTVKATDSFENMNEAALSFSVDLDAPVITINPLESYINITYLTVNGGIADVVKSDITEVKYQLDTEEWVVLADGFTNTTFEFELTDLIEGEHSIKVQAKDAGEHLSNIASEDFIVDITAPVVTVDAPDFTNQESIDITGTVGDAYAISTMVYQINDGEWMDIPIDNIDGAGYMFTITGLTEGIKTVKVKATDMAGNESAVAEDTFTVDFTNPVVAISEPADSYITELPFDVSGTITGAKGKGVATVLYKIDTAAWTEVTIFTNTTFEFTVSTLIEGEHTISVKATDEAGNESEVETLTIIYDATLPVAQNYVAKQHTDFAGGATVSVEMQISDVVSV